MEFVAAVVALGPVVLMMALLVLRTRQLRPRRPVTTTGRWPTAGGGAAGVREPRRPLVPAGAMGVALEEPGDEPAEALEVPEPAPARVVPVVPPWRRLRAS